MPAGRGRGGRTGARPGPAEGGERCRGAAAGDAYLRRTAEVLRDNSRPSDIVVAGPVVTSSRCWSRSRRIGAGRQRRRGLRRAVGRELSAADCPCRSATPRRAGDDAGTGGGSLVARPRPADEAASGVGGRGARAASTRPDALKQSALTVTLAERSVERDFPMRDAVIVEAVRTPIGKRNGGLSGRPPGGPVRPRAPLAGRAGRHRPGRRRRRHLGLRHADRRADARHRAHRGARGRLAGDACPA